MGNEEIFDLYTCDRQPLYKTAKRGSCLLDGEFHLVAMAIMINECNEILITKRSMNKPGAGKWECTAGSVMAGETTKQAIQREVKEEIGIMVEVEDENLIGCFFEEDAIFDIWKIKVQCRIDDLILQSNEVDDARYIKIDDIQTFIDNNPCTSSLYEVSRLYSEGSL